MIVAIAGRRIDPVNATQERFPSRMAGSVKLRLLNIFKSIRASHVVSSGACGTDLLALQAAFDLNIPSTMVLPFDSVTFKSTSVTDRPGDWGDIYEEILHHLKLTGDVIEMNYLPDDPAAYENTNLLILDHAREKAASPATNNEQLLALIVWEGQPKDSDDTTYHFMQEAQKRNFLTRELKIADD